MTEIVTDGSRRGGRTPLESESLSIAISRRGVPLSREIGGEERGCPDVPFFCRGTSVSFAFVAPRDSMPKVVGRIAFLITPTVGLFIST